MGWLMSVKRAQTFFSGLRPRRRAGITSGDHLVSRARHRTRVWERLPSLTSSVYWTDIFDSRNRIYLLSNRRPRTSCDASLLYRYLAT
jgi:hypothetical protein